MEHSLSKKAFAVWVSMNVWVLRSLLEHKVTLRNGGEGSVFISIEEHLLAHNFNFAECHFV